MFPFCSTCESRGNPGGPARAVPALGCHYREAL
jgi:hypothetical protein